MIEYRFTEDWFSCHIPVWQPMFHAFQPKTILEIGSHEGRATVWMMEIMNMYRGGTVVCVDTWGDPEAEENFLWNVKTALSLFPTSVPQVFKAPSAITLATLRHTKEKYDLVYIDASHKSRDVMSDAIDGFHLCRKGGIIIFDDYINDYGNNPLDTPKMAIDSFVNCFARDLEIVMTPIDQMIVRKR